MMVSSVLLIHWDIPKLISHHMMINRGKMTTREEDEWLLLSLRERSRKPRSRQDLTITLEDISSVRRKILLFPELKQQINLKLLARMEKKLRIRTCHECHQQLENYDNGQWICMNCGGCFSDMLSDEISYTTHKQHSKVPYSKIRCLKLNLKQLTGNYPASKWFPIYEQIKGELYENITLIELREIMKKHRKSKAYPMANAILYHHRGMSVDLKEEEREALFHLFQTYHDKYVEISTRTRKTMRFSHFLIKVLPCVGRKDLRKFVVDVKDTTKKKNMELMWLRIRKESDLRNQMKYYRTYFLKKYTAPPIPARIKSGVKSNLSPPISGDFDGT